MLGIERGKLIERPEDMSPDGRLGVLIQNDGDVIIVIKPSKDDPDYDGSPLGVSVEFCTRAGGGRSLHTRKALMDLYLAIQRDNEEHPIA